MSNILLLMSGNGLNLLKLSVEAFLLFLLLIPYANSRWRQ